jgi:DNA processing protein
VFSRLSAGPNGLLRAGAAPVLTADDVLAALGLPPRPSAAGAEEPPLLALIRPGESVTVDRLAAESRLPVAQVLEALVALELGGRVVREADGSYRRSHVNPDS